MIVTMRGLTKRYKDKYALRDFSAELENGVYGLMGVNGAGKTTLLSIFVGILRADGGQVLIDGKEAGSLGASFYSHIGFLPQTTQFYKDFTVMEFLRYMAALKGIDSRAGEKRAEELLEIVNLTDRAEKKIGALSGGMRQRVGIVQAMLGDPSILVLDEPTAGLDPQERIRFRNLIGKFAAGRIVILATHIVSDVESIANQVMMMKDGRLLRQDSPAHLIRDMEGKVWQVKADDGNAEAFLKQYRVSNILREETTVRLRIISDRQPSVDAVQLQPNLEDVFLYYAGGSETW